MQNNNKTNLNFGPVRESVVFLVARLALILIVFETLYAAIFYFLKLGFTLPLNLHHHTSEVLFALAIIKILAEVYLVTYVAFSWSANAYFIEGKKLVKKTGLLTSKEDIFLFDRIQSVSQSFLGKILNYGNITFKHVSIKNNEENVVIWRVDNPKRYMNLIVAI